MLMRCVLRLGIFALLLAAALGIPFAGAEIWDKPLLVDESGDVTLNPPANQPAPSGIADFVDLTAFWFGSESFSEVAIGFGVHDLTNYTMLNQGSLPPPVRNSWLVFRATFFEGDPDNREYEVLIYYSNNGALPGSGSWDGYVLAKKEGHTEKDSIRVEVDLQNNIVKGRMNRMLFGDPEIPANLTLQQDSVRGYVYYPNQPAGFSDYIPHPLLNLTLEGSPVYVPTPTQPCLVECASQQSPLAIWSLILAVAFASRWRKQ